MSIQDHERIAHKKKGNITKAGWNRKKTKTKTKPKKKPTT